MECNNMPFCRICDKTFKNRKQLSKHMSRVHKLIKASVKCGSCKKLFRTLDNYRYHVNKFHEVNMECKKMRFSTREVFQKWLAEEERNTSSRYIRQRGERKHRGYSQDTLICHRSGVYKPCGVGIRRLKSQGSLKIGFYCTAGIKAKYFSNHVVVEYCKTHFGHSDSLSYVPTRKEKQESIAGNPTNKQITKKARKKEDSSKLNHAGTSTVTVLRSETGTQVSRIKSHYDHDNNLDRTCLNKPDQITENVKNQLGILKGRVLGVNEDNIIGESAAKFNRSDTVNEDICHIFVDSYVEIKDDISNEAHEDNDICVNTIQEDSANYTGVSISNNRDRIYSAIASLQETANNCVDFENIDISVANQICSLLKKTEDLLKSSTESDRLIDIVMVYPRKKTKQ